MQWIQTVVHFKCNSPGKNTIIYSPMLTSLYSPARCVLLSTSEDAGSELWSEDLSPARSKAPLYLSLDNECIVLVSKDIS